MLSKSIDELATSDEFLEMTAANGLNNLGQILNYPVYELMKMKGFNFRMLAELILILRGFDLLELLKED